MPSFSDAMPLGSTLDTLHLFGDATRVRLMALLSKEELTVAELVKVTGLAQSRVSTHLGKLREAGLLRDRKVGSSTFYAASDGAMPDGARRLWELIEGDVDDPILTDDQRRCDELIQAREAAEPWPDAVAGQMERHYSPGRTWEATARGLLGLVHLGDALDIGSGDGAITQLLVPRARSITCLDRSDKMITAARKRLQQHAHVDYRVGDLHELPFEAARFDQVLMFNVLTYAHSPKVALGEAARVLRRGGTLVVVTLNRHEHREITDQYNHLQPGFDAATLRGWLERSGLRIDFCEVTSREKRAPYFEVVSAFATQGET